MKYLCDENFFSRNTPESFYWAGFIAADGCVKLKNAKYKQLSVCLCADDVKHLEKFKESIKFEGNIGTYYYNGCSRSNIEISSDKIFDDLSRFNVVPRKSLVLEFPEWLLRHNLIHHFMRGYNDGDGSFFIQQLKNDRKIKQIMFSLRGTKQFLSTFRDILEEKCGLEHNDKKPRADSGIYTLEYGGNRKALKIRDFLYKDSTNETRLDRKYDLAFSEQFNLPVDFKFKKVLGTEISTGQERQYDSLKSAEIDGFSRVQISACCRKAQNTHKGYTWKYV